MVYAWVIERIPRDKLDEFDESLIEPLPWQDVDSDAAVEYESASFMAMQAKGGGS